MTKRKDRTLKELYHISQKITQPEITPVLRGRFRIQGPMDEAGQEFWENTGSVTGDLRSYKGPVSDKFHMKPESGTCNLCAAPCSSCMHVNSALSAMESKIEDECSNELCGEKENSVFQSKACHDRQATASETSNLMSPSSSHDSFSENAESNATVKTRDTFEDAEGVRQLSKGGNFGEGQIGRSSGVPFQGGVHVSTCKDSPSVLGQRSMSRKYDQKGLDCHGDNLSCVTGAKDSIISSVKEDPGVSSAMNLRSKSDPSEVHLSKLRIGDSKALAESQHEPSESSIELAESSLVGQTTSCADVQKVALRPIDDSKSSLGKSTSSAGALMKIHLCLETESGDSENVSSKVKESMSIHNQTGDNGSLYGETRIQKTSSQLVSDSEPSGSDVLEDDVKVCDICGDTGREELLAICSRCSDGAEHTYCMRIMMNRVPEGDWLCEGCKLKEEPENEKSAKHESDDVFGKNESVTSPKLPSSSGQSQQSGPLLNQKDKILPKLSKLPKLDVKSQEAEVVRPKSIMSPLSTKRQFDNMEVSSRPKRHAVEAVVVSNGKRTTLTRDSSFKNSDAPQSLAASSPNSARAGTRLLSPKGTLSMSNAFSSINSKPKVKQVSDDFTQKQKLTKGLGIIDSKKEGSNRTLNKSLSFKTTSSGRSNANDLKANLQTSKVSCAEGLKGLKIAKEKQPVEGRNTVKFERPMVFTAPSIPNNQSFPNPDSAVTGVSKGPGPAISGGGGEEKNLLTSNGMSNSEEQKPYHTGHKEEWKSKDISSLSGSRQATSAGNRVVRGPALKGPALKAPAQRNSREGPQKSSKWKDVVQAAMSKNAKLKTVNKPPEKFDERPGPSMDIDSEAATCKDQLCSSSSLLRSFSSMESAQPSKEVDEKPSISHGCKLVIASSVIPEHDYIWQGGFEVYRSGRSAEFFYGLQAHLSSVASAKVPGVVNRFSPKVLVEEVPRLNSWPVQFQREGATEDNIALYFFAKDLDSYEKGYKKLVDNMIKNDLALKGHFNGVDLLVFPSNQLPEKAHCWNRLFYLWAVFRERTEIGAEPLPSSRKRVHGDGLGVDHTAGERESVVGEQGSCAHVTNRGNIWEQENRVDDEHHEETDFKKDPVENEDYSLDFRVNRKRPHSDCLDAVSEASVETSRASQSQIFKEKAYCAQDDREKEHKKLKSYSSDIDGFSCRTDDSFLKVEQDGDHLCGVTLFPENLRATERSLPENLRATERSFFPVNFGPVNDNKLESTSWNMISPKEEEPMEPDLPNLELALGGEKKSSKKKVLPLFLQLIEERHANSRALEPAVVDSVDEASAGLSLSLSFPGPEKKPTVKPVSKTEQLLPESRHVNTSLLLFGGFTDSKF